MYTNDSHSMQNEGGFMDSSVHNTSTSSGGPSGTKRGDHCIPVMIAHLNRSGEDLQVWGVSAKLISLAAIVTKIEILSTKVTFEFRDETGLLVFCFICYLLYYLQKVINIHSYKFFKAP